MSIPDRNNPYSFDAYLNWRENFDYYLDDPQVLNTLKTFTGDAWQKVDPAVTSISQKVSGRWKTMADEAARPENRPSIIHFNAHNQRIDRLARSRDTEIMEREVFSEALFSDKTCAWEKLIKMFLIYQNGEASISCPLACTDGLVALLERYANNAELKQIRDHLKEGIDGEYAIAAQYISEIQGGSDVPANLLEAVEQAGEWRLYGNKFFCSATHADYSVVTAKPAGSEKIAAFVVPSWLPGDKQRQRRNGYSIDRIKWKMGTCELITAEISYQGAKAYPVGPLDEGLAIVVGIVLAASRLSIGIFSAAVMTRAVREAIKYAEFRIAFGQPIERFPMLAGQLQKMQNTAQRTTAGVFKFYRAMLELEGGMLETDESTKSTTMRKQRFDARELIMLQKIITSSDSIETLRSAMSVFGGHGVIEDFSSLPRLFRDAMVNELWEGPKNVLLAQIHRDLQKASGWYKPDEFVSRVLSGAEKATIEYFSEQIASLVAHPSLNTSDDETFHICARWELFCQDLFHAYQDLALAEVNNTH